MGTDRNNDTRFLVQGSILAAASIISRIIGLLYRIPMYRIIGDIGNDYYSCAYELYNIVLLLSSFSLPMAISKLVSARLATHQKMNVIKTVRTALVFAICIGAAGFCVLFFGAVRLTEMFQTPMSFLALQVLAPTVFVVAILGVLRGFFQGLGSNVPTAVSQIIEQLLHVGVGLAAASLLFAYGARIGRVLGSDKNYAEAYGAAGATFGTFIGGVGALIFLIIIFSLVMPRVKLGIRRERRLHPYRVESSGHIFKIMMATIIPILLSTTIYNSITIVDQAVFKNAAVLQGYAADDISTMWGVFSGKYRVLVNVPTAIADAIGVSCVPALAMAFARKDTEAVRKRISLAMRYILTISMPMAAGLIVLARPVMSLLFGGETEDLAARLLMYGSVSIVFFCITTLCNAMLQGIDRMAIPIRNGIISLVVHAGVLFAVIWFFDANIYGVIIAQYVFSGMMSLMNIAALKRYSGFSLMFGKTFVKPAIASGVMAAVVYFVYKIGYGFYASNLIWTAISIVVGIIVYFIVFLAIRGFSEAELSSLPKGAALVRLAKKFHLM